MDYEQLEQLGDELREVGHRRRRLVEEIYREVQEGDQASSKDLFAELSQISDKAISIIEQQKQLFDHEVQRM